MSDDWKQVVQGYDEAMAAFDYLNSTVKAEMLEQGLNASAHALETEMRSRAPKLTGNLKLSIVSKVLPALIGGTVRSVIVGAAIDGPMGKSKGDRSAWYAISIERGYHAMGRRKRNRTKSAPLEGGRWFGARFIPPRPFVKPTGDAIYPKVPGLFHSALEESLNRFSSRNLKRWSSK